jgi:hypothetical protein
MENKARKWSRSVCFNVIRATQSRISERARTQLAQPLSAAIGARR